jgi:hypothetical protein
VREVLNLAEPLHLIISLENSSSPVLNAYRIAGGEAIPEAYNII